MTTFLGYDMVTPVSVTSNQPHFNTTTLNLKQQSVVSPSHRWEMAFQLGPSTDGRLQGTVMSHRTVNGYHTAFEVNIPQHHGLDVEADPVPVLSTAANATTVRASFPPGLTIPAGWYVRFSNHSKVYLVTESVTNSTTGNLVRDVNIFPALQTAVVTNNTMQVQDVTMRCKYSPESPIGYTYTAGLATNAQVGVVEDV